MADTGKFLLRLNPRLHRELKVEADRSGVSLNQLLISRIASSPDSLKSVTAKLADFFGDKLVGVVLYGSRVRGENTATSDIDLLCVLNESVVIERELYNRVDQLLESQKENFSVQIVKMIDALSGPSNLWLEVALEGEILFDPKNELRRFLAELKDKIASGEFLRKLSYGQPYWVKGGE